MKIMAPKPAVSSIVESVQRAVGFATSKGSQSARLKAGDIPLVLGNTAEGLTAFDISQASPPNTRQVYRRASLAYAQPATAEAKARMKLGVFPLVFDEDPPAATFATNDGIPNATPFLGTCNTVVFRMMGKMKTPTRSGSANVIVQCPSASSIPLPPDPANPGCVPASAGPALTDGVLVFGSNGQDLARLFLRSFNVVGTQCDVILFNVPLCDITCYDCGDTFEGASEQLYPLLPIVKDMNAALDVVEANCQVFEQNNDTEGCLPCVLVPVTVGAPTNNCAGVYDFARPLISLADSPVNVSLEVNPACREDLAEFFKLIDQDTNQPIKASIHNSGLVGDLGYTDLDASGAQTIFYFGGFCFTLEFHALRMTNEDLARCWTKYSAPEAVCDKLWPAVCNTCKGIPVVDDSGLELDEHGQPTGNGRNGEVVLRKPKQIALGPSRSPRPVPLGKPRPRG